MLGASVGGIAALLSTDFVKLVVVAIIIAVPVSYYALTTWIQDFPYRITLSWGYFALAAFLAMGVAIVTVGYQSLRAALMNPVESLRSE